MWWNVSIDLVMIYCKSFGWNGTNYQYNLYSVGKFKDITNY